MKDLNVQPLDLTWNSLEDEDVLARLDVSLDGLNPRVVGERLTHWGANQIQERPSVTPWRLLVKKFASPFVWLLLAAAILAFSVSFLPGQEGRRITGFFILDIVAIRSCSIRFSVNNCDFSL